MTASIAGSSVNAARIAVSTAIAAVMPSMVTVGIPATTSPSRAIATVRPATSTARPALPRARGIASATVRPARSSSRWRLTMKTA